MAWEQAGPLPERSSTGSGNGGGIGGGYLPPHLRNRERVRLMPLLPVLPVLA
jgi:hypothetical protein